MPRIEMLSCAIDTYFKYVINVYSNCVPYKFWNWWSLNFERKLFLKYSFSIFVQFLQNPLESGAQAIVVR